MADKDPLDSTASNAEHKMNAESTPIQTPVTCADHKDTPKTCSDSYCNSCKTPNTDTSNSCSCNTPHSDSSGSCHTKSTTCSPSSSSNNYSTSKSHTKSITCTSRDSSYTDDSDSDSDSDYTSGSHCTSKSRSTSGSHNTTNSHHGHSGNGAHDTLKARCEGYACKFASNGGVPIGDEGVGLFASFDIFNKDEGLRQNITVAAKTEHVIGVITDCAGVVTGYDHEGQEITTDMFTVVTHGPVVARDNGRCIPGHQCWVCEGVAYPGTRYWVMSRIDENHIKIFMGHAH